MGLFSFFKRNRKTNFAGFRSYNRSSKILRRKPIETKRSILPDSITNRRSKKFDIIKNKAALFIKGASILALVALSIYLIFFTDVFTIQKIEIKGELEMVEEQGIINEYLQKYLSSNIIFFSSGKHEINLRKDLSYLKTLSIYRVLPHTVVAKIETFPLAANIKIRQPGGTSQFYVVNELGYISSIGTTNETLPTIVMDVTGTDLEITEGEQSNTPKINAEILPAETLATILAAKTDFEGKFKLQIIETEYLKRAKELHLYTELYFYIWIDMTQDLDLQLAKMKKALTKLNIYESTIDYIDLRISGHDGEKVIYKLKE